MVTKQVKTLGLLINVLVPASVEEYDQLAKKSGAALESANANTIYRSVLAKVRDGFTDKLAELTGIARKTKESGKFEKFPDGSKNDAGEDVAGKDDPSKPILVYIETEADYFDRVIVETKSPRESFASLVQEVADTVKFDPSASEATPKGPKVTAAIYLKTAQDLIDAGRGEIVAAKLSESLGLVVEPTKESLGAAIAEDQRRKKAALANEYA